MFFFFFFFSQFLRAYDTDRTTERPVVKSKSALSRAVDQFVCRNSHRDVKNEPFSGAEYDRLIKPIMITAKIISIWPLAEDSTKGTIMFRRFHVFCKRLGRRRKALKRDKIYSKRSTDSTAINPELNGSAANNSEI